MASTRERSSHPTTMRRIHSGQEHSAARRAFLAMSLSAGAGICLGVRPGTVAAQDEALTTEHCHCGDQMWLVSTRHLGDCPGFATPDCFDYRQCVAGQWCRVTHVDYMNACAEGIPAVVYVHGNRADLNTAIQDGTRVYQSLIRCWRRATPIRFVIWAWPSDRTCGLRRDVRVKASRTDRQALLLAGLMTQTSTCAPSTLIGYSYGARLAAGALHALGGGFLCGDSLASYGFLDYPPGDYSRPTHSVWWAGAFPNRWILPGHRYGNAIHAAGQVMIMYNRHDPVLRRYARVLRERDGHAIGYVGVPIAGQLGCDAQRIRVCDVTRAVGKRHDWERYIASGRVLDATRCSIAVA